MSLHVGSVQGAINQSPRLCRGKCGISSIEDGVNMLTKIVTSIVGGYLTILVLLSVLASLTWPIWTGYLIWEHSLNRKILECSSLPTDRAVGYGMDDEMVAEDIIYYPPQL